MDASRFAEFLIAQQPVYDKLILQDIRPMDGWNSGPRTLPIDVRLLPNRLRIAYCRNTQYISDHLKISRRSASRLKMQAYRMIGDRIKAWIRKLPPKQKRIEKRKRRNKIFVKTGDWEKYAGNIEDKLDRFHAVFPDVSKEWSK